MHNLEIGANGQVAFATRKEPGWHNLGTVFDQTVSTEEMLSLAHLDGWNVRSIPLVTDARSNAGHVEIVRDNPFDGGLDRLGIAKERYTPMQNEEIFSVANNIVDGAGTWETAGSLGDGRRVFGTIEIDKSFVIDPSGASDEVKSYIIATGGHDGATGISFFLSPVRVECQNTLNMAFGGAKNFYRLRHTPNVSARASVAREVLGLTFKHFDALEAEAAALYQTAVTNDKFDEIVKSLYPEPEPEQKAARTKWDEKTTLIWDIYLGRAAGPDTMSTITGTGWGVLNALTEHIDWYRPVRKGDASNMLAAQMGFDTVAAAAKERVLSTVRAALL